MTSKIVVTEIKDVFSVYHKEGSTCDICGRTAYGLTFTEKGRIIYHKGDRTITEDAHHAVLLPMGGSYSLRCEQSGIFPIVNFLTAVPLSSDIVMIPITRAELFTDRFEALREAFFSYGSAARSLSLLYDLFDEMSREEKSGEPRAVARATDYMLSHYARASLSVEEVAAAVGISEPYLRQLFGSALKISPKAYLTEVRLKRARELLSLGLYKVNEVAELCGYASIYHFSRAFKQQTGLTPREYAERHPRLAL